MCVLTYYPCSCIPVLGVCLLTTLPQAQAQCEVAKLLPTQPLGVLHFGKAVSISDDLLIVGADLDYSPLPKAGSAFIFRREGRHWIEEANLTASDAGIEDRFGISVAVSGDLAAVGSFGHDHMGEESGAAYVFRRVSSSWVEEAELLASDAAVHDGFGFSIDIDGQVIAVGAVGNDDAGESSGSVYIFRRNDNGTPADPDDDSWFEEAKLTASDAAAGALFGHSVSISSDRVLVGARDADGAATDSGSAYVFQREGLGWMEEAKLVGSDSAAYDHFGYSVSLDGLVAVVGATAHKHPDTDEVIGAAYVFRHDENGTPYNPGDDFWVEEAELTASDAAAYDSFGWSVSISEGRIMVGTPWTSDAAPAAGSAYLFEQVGSSWVEQGEFTASDAAEDDHFAGSLSISGDFFVAGAVAHDHAGGNVGAAYVFAVAGDDCNANDTPDICETDTDGDDVIDDCDVCPGFNDNVDSDEDGTPDGCDGCPHDADKLDAGVCGCGVPDEGDNDGDGVLDCIDQCPGLDDGVFAPDCVTAIPTVSHWGILVLTLLLLAAAKARFAGRGVGSSNS